MLQVVTSLTRDPPEAKDLFQGTLLCAYRAIEGFDGRHFPRLAPHDRPEHAPEPGSQAATGLSVSSVYAAYGSKQGLFRAAIQRYEEHMGNALGDLADVGIGLGDVVEFVEHARVGIGSDVQPAGCLMVNTMVEVPATDTVIGELTSRYRARVRESLERALARAERSDEITRQCRARAALVQAALFGALVIGRAGGVDEADRMLRGLISEIR